jgi:hypothetical protein
LKPNSLSPKSEVCEAFGCFARVTEEIKLSVGEMGEISLAARFREKCTGVLR